MGPLNEWGFGTKRCVGILGRGYQIILRHLHPLGPLGLWFCIPKQMRRQRDALKLVWVPTQMGVVCLCVAINPPSGASPDAGIRTQRCKDEGLLSCPQ